MKTAIKIGNTLVGKGHKPFVIAEMSGNHNQSLDQALRIVRSAAETGVDALKLQTYRADTITLNATGGLFDIMDQGSLWNGRNLYDLYDEAHTPWEWHKEIFDLANSYGMLGFSSPFDESAVDYLENLAVPAYKIASFENNHYPLLKKVAQTGKPIIISSGASRLSEIKNAVDYLQSEGANEIIVLKCTSTYPASPENTNLNTIPVLQKIFPNCQIGLSDHTLGIGASIAAVALGATVIEKHFTVSRSEGGVDSAFSMEPVEMKLLCDNAAIAQQAMGEIQLDTQKDEEKSKQFKRSIYVSKDITSGEKFSRDNIQVVRPGDGLHPMFFEEVIGRSAKHSISFGTPLKWENI